MFCILPIRGISEIRGLPQLADRAEVALLLDQFSNERRPAGLMRGAQAAAIVAVEIFVKPIELGISRRIECTGESAEERPLAFLIAEPELDQTV